MNDKPLCHHPTDRIESRADGDYYICCKFGCKERLRPYQVIDLLLARVDTLERMVWDETV